MTRITGTLLEGQHTFMIISRSVLHSMRSVSDRSCTESQNAYFMFSNIFQISWHLWDNVEKYCRAWQTTDDNIAHVHCMLDTQGYKHTLTIFLLSHHNNAYTNAPKCYITSQLSVSLHTTPVRFADISETLTEMFVCMHSTVYRT